MRFIMVTMLIDMIGIGLIIPVLPVFVGQFTHSLAEQAFWFGAIAFTFSVANFFASPVLGALSDHYGRRPVLLLGFTGFGISFFVTAVVTQLWMLIAIRLVSGALMANAAIANAYVADITPPEKRAQRFGQLGAMLGLGFIPAPALGGAGASSWGRRGAGCSATTTGACRSLPPAPAPSSTSPTAISCCPNRC